MYLNAIVGIAFLYRNEKTIDPFEKSYNVFKSCQKWSFCCHIQSKNNKITWDTNLTELEKLIHIFTKHIACHRRKCPLERSSKCCPTETFSKLAVPISVHKKWNYRPFIFFHILIEQTLCVLPVPFLILKKVTVCLLCEGHVHPSLDLSWAKGSCSSFN